MGIKFTNFAKAQIASAPSGTAGLSFTVAAGTGLLYPALAAGDYFYGVFKDASGNREIVKVDARSTDALTIAVGGRGLDGTTARTWAAGDYFVAGIVATALNESFSGNQTIAGNKIFTGSITPAQTLGIVGTTTNNDALAGSVGEFKSSVIAQGSAVALTSFTDKTVCNVMLTAGDWDVFGSVEVATGATTSITQVQGGLSLLDNVIDEAYKFAFYTGAFVPGPSANLGGATPRRRVQVATGNTTVVYLIARAGFTVSTAAAWGRIDARRIR